MTPDKKWMDLINDRLGEAYGQGIENFLYYAFEKTSATNEIAESSDVVITMLPSSSNECVALEELYLSHNGIQKMEGLSTLENLRVLDISSNKLTAIGDIEKLTRLEDLWLNDNQISSLEGIGLAVSGSREKLKTIYLERNVYNGIAFLNSFLKVMIYLLFFLDSMGAHDMVMFLGYNSRNNSSMRKRQLIGVHTGSDLEEEEEEEKEEENVNIWMKKIWRKSIFCI